MDKDRHFSEAERKALASFQVGLFFATAREMHWLSTEDDAVRLSWNLVPKEVLDYIRHKAFWISGVENQELLNAIQGKLEAAIRDGTDYRKFAREVRSLIDSLGVSGDTPFRLDTIFRTNVFSSYTIGQLEQLDQVKDRFPLWRYLAILDSRTRPLHRELNGKIFPVGEGPIPPIDFNCRCSMQPLHELEVSRGDIKPTPPGEMTTILRGEQVMRFDQKAEFQRWIAQKSEGMDSRIRLMVNESRK